MQPRSQSAITIFCSSTQSLHRSLPDAPVANPSALLSWAFDGYLYTDLGQSAPPLCPSQSPRDPRRSSAVRFTSFFRLVTVLIPNRHVTLHLLPDRLLPTDPAVPARQYRWPSPTQSATFVLLPECVSARRRSGYRLARHPRQALRQLRTLSPANRQALSVSRQDTRQYTPIHPPNRHSFFYPSATPRQLPKYCIPSQYHTFGPRHCTLRHWYCSHPSSFNLDPNSYLYPLSICLGPCRRFTGIPTDVNNVVWMVFP